MADRELVCVVNDVELYVGDILIWNALNTYSNLVIDTGSKVEVIQTPMEYLREGYIRIKPIDMDAKYIVRPEYFDLLEPIKRFEDGDGLSDFINGF